MFLFGKGRPRGERGPFFGPLLRYDLIRSSRSGQQIGHRCLYACVLLLLLGLVYSNYVSPRSYRSIWNPYGQWLQRTSMPARERAAFAASFFAHFMEAQFAIVLLITPLYAAGAIAEEKERRTLEFLFVTDLSNREIILGILGARLGKLLLLVLTGLPFLSLLEFLGGVDPNLVLAGFVATVMLMLSLGSMSILVSVHSPTALSATVSAYLLTLLVACSLVLPFYGGALAAIELTDSGVGFAASNVALLVVVFTFCAVHGLIAILCSWSAITEVRRLGLRPAHETGFLTEVVPLPRDPYRLEPNAGEESSEQPRGWGPFPAPETSFVSPPDTRTPRRPVGNDALIWKEIYYESSTLQNDAAQFFAALLVAFFFIFMLMVGVPGLSMGGEEATRAMRTIGTALSAILFLIVALSAAGRVSRERQRGTLGDLFTLPVSSESILFTKWLGSILCMRWLWPSLAVVWLTGAVVGAIHVFALPLVGAAAVVYAAFFASLGLWLSTVCRSRLRASLLTLLVTLLVMIGPGSSVPLLVVGGAIYGRPDNLGDWGMFYLAYGLSPAATLWVLAFTSPDLLQHPAPTMAYLRLVAAMVGVHGYMLAAALLWLFARAHLRREKGPRSYGPQAPAGFPMPADDAVSAAR
jgi:ABC-type transport system involved in multi-copper enzyme maturation permease subunit